MQTTDTAPLSSLRASRRGIVLGGLAAAALAPGAAPAAADPALQGMILGPGPQGGPDDGRVGVGAVHRDPASGDWMLWYSCRDAAFPSIAPPTLGTGRVALARSSDGVKWEKIRGRGPGGSLIATLRDDDVFASWPNGVFDGERTWLYLTAVDQKLAKFRTHCFVSRDGLDWEHRGELRWTQAEATWQQHGLMTRHIQRNPFPGRKWLMLYTALDADRSRFDRRTIGAASSDDLVTWTQLFPEPIFVPSDESNWDGGGVSAPQLVVGRRDMRLYYFGFPTKARDAVLPKGMGLATTRSRDLRSFRRVERAA